MTLTFKEHQDTRQVCVCECYNKWKEGGASSHFIKYLDAQVSQMCQFCSQLNSKSFQVDTMCFDPAPCDLVNRKGSMEDSMMLILIINLIRSTIN